MKNHSRGLGRVRLCEQRGIVCDGTHRAGCIRRVNETRMLKTVGTRLR